MRLISWARNRQCSKRASLAAAFRQAFQDRIRRSSTSTVDWLPPPGRVILLGGPFGSERCRRAQAILVWALIRPRLAELHSIGRRYGPRWARVHKRAHPAHTTAPRLPADHFELERAATFPVSVQARQRKRQPCLLDRGRTRGPKMPSESKKTQQPGTASSMQLGPHIARRSGCPSGEFDCSGPEKGRTKRRSTWSREITAPSHHSKPKLCSKPRSTSPRSLPAFCTNFKHPCRCSVPPGSERRSISNIVLPHTSYLSLLFYLLLLQNFRLLTFASSYTCFLGLDLARLGQDATMLHAVWFRNTDMCASDCN